MRRVLIHTRLGFALAVPLTSLVAVAALEALQSTRDAREVRDQASIVKAATGPNGLFNALQDERNRAFIDLVGQSELIELPVADNVAARGEAERALSRFAEQIGSQPAVVRDAYAPAFEELEDLGSLRGSVDAVPGPFDLGNVDAAEAAFWRYTALVDALLDANARVAVAIDDAELRRGADLSYLASRQTDLIARLVSTVLVASVSEGGLDTRDELVQASGLHRLAVVGTATIEDLAHGDYAEVAATMLDQHRSLGFLDRVVPEIIETRRLDVAAVLTAVSVPRDESYYGFRTNVKEILEQEADRLAASAERRARAFQALAAVAVLVAAAVAWSVARSLGRCGS